MTTRKSSQLCVEHDRSSRGKKNEDHNRWVMEPVVMHAQPAKFNPGSYPRQNGSAHVCAPLADTGSGTVTLAENSVSIVHNSSWSNFSLFMIDHSRDPRWQSLTHREKKKHDVSSNCRFVHFHPFSPRFTNTVGRTRTPQRRNMATM